MTQNMQEPTPCGDRVRRSAAPMRKTLANGQFINHIARLLAKAPRGFSNLRDVDAVRKHPDARSPHRWFTAWMERAEAAHTLAREALRWGDAPSAASAYLRASEYYRAAASAYWPERSDAAIADAMRLHAECFRAALDLDGPPYRPFEIPAGRATVAGYLLWPVPDPEDISRPVATLMCCGPSDGTAEEQYGLLGAEALRLGWLVMLADPSDLERACECCDGPRMAMSAMRVWLAEMPAGTPPRLALAGLGDGRRLAWKLVSGDGRAEVIWPAPGRRPAERPAGVCAASDAAALSSALSALRVPAAVLACREYERAPSMTGVTPCDALNRIRQEA